MNSDFSHLFAAISPSGISLTMDEIEAGIQLDHLRPGQWFATILANQENTGMEVMTGRLVYPGVGSCLVELDRSWQNLIRWCPMTKVLPIPTPERAKFLPLVPAEVELQIKSIEERPMSVEQEKVALRKRYKFYQEKMATASTDLEVTTAANALVRIEDEAKALGVDLTIPETVKTITPTSEVTQVTATGKVTKAKKGAKSVQGAEQVSEKAAALAADAGKRVPGATKVKKDKVLQPCLDGCGAMVPGNFQMGHDAKLKSILGKIEKGELETSAVPDIVQGIVKFKKGESEDIIKDGKKVGKVQHMVLLAAPVKFYGRPEIELTTRE